METMIGIKRSTLDRRRSRRIADNRAVKLELVREPSPEWTMGDGRSLTFPVLVSGKPPELTPVVALIFSERGIQ